MAARDLTIRSDSSTMPELELSQTAQQWVNVVLIWVGFGTLSGLLATLVLPMRQPSSPLGALLVGILGSLIGLLGLSWLLQGRQFNPISPIGFLAATAAAILILILYRAARHVSSKRMDEAIAVEHPRISLISNR